MTGGNSESAGKRKYPRTPHLPFSEGATSDDKWMSPSGLAHLRSGIDLVVTEKMDGGNMTMSRDFIHARSLDASSQPWDSRAKALWASIRWNIPEGMRISGESVYARRSVTYEHLQGPFLVFGAWMGDTLLGWDETVEWAELLNLPTVPVLYRGDSFEDAACAWSKVRTPSNSEGFVIRDANEFDYKDFSEHIAKYVRAGHVQTSADWRHRDDFAVNGFDK